MKFKFDANQSFQVEAIDSVVADIGFRVCRLYCPSETELIARCIWVDVFLNPIPRIGIAKIEYRVYDEDVCRKGTRL